MLTQEQVLAEASTRDRGGAGMLDGRDYCRLAAFFPHEKWAALGVELKEGAEVPEPSPWTKEAVLEQLGRDLSFAFEKALDKRGISASLMYSTVKMWMWVLEDDLKDCEDYAQYGLPLLKRVAVKYGLANPIGDDDGDEDKYSQYGGD